MNNLALSTIKLKLQKRSVRTMLLAAALAAGQALLLLTANSGSAQQQPYEAYYNYLGNYPDDANTGWHEEAQGLAHDQDNWFITQREWLWKVHVSRNLNDLNNVDKDDQKVIVKTLCPLRKPQTKRCERADMTDMPKLLNEGYDHLGDPVYFYHEFSGQGYVLVPVERPGEIGRRPAIAAFRASDLVYVNHAYLTGQTHAAWCAIDPQGRVYSSSEDLGPVNRYVVDWSALLSARTPLTLPNPTQIQLTDESKAPVKIRKMQGGELSPSGQLLYLVSVGGGIQVFDLSTMSRVQRSTNGSGYFNYEYHTNFPVKQEPEGLTIWDLDNDRAPGIKGQLHVLLLNNDWPDDDNVYMKHYTGTIYVDRAYTGEEKGIPSKPFRTVGQANDLAWDGAQIKIKTGTYPEALTFSKRIRVLVENGPVIIGQR